MAHNSPGVTSGPRPRQLPTWWTIVFFLVILGISWWQTRTPNPNPLGPARPSAPAKDDEVEPAHRPILPEVSQEQRQSTEHSRTSSQSGRESQPSTEPSRERVETDSTLKACVIKDQKIRDQDGKLIYSGTIDLGPTLKRIDRGEANSHRHDGTTFQNRERRLPSKPSGYYKEYVHPTPNTSGPGPQRVIVGKDGDVWYTPDHYRTFQRIQ